MNKPSKSKINFKIDPLWKEFLLEDFNRNSFQELTKFLEKERKHHLIYPEESLFFEAFNRTALSKLRVVIIGQDPYHGEGQAHGLAFSVPDGIKLPPSLKNIFKELKSDLSIDIPISGNLEKWSDRGVLLLNASLSVRVSSPGSHHGKGWEEFTNSVISKISKKCNNLVFILWGKFAQEKSALIDSNKHCTLKSAHPSPFSAYRGFFGCRHFSKANEFLESKGVQPINWNLNE